MKQFIINIVFFLFNTLLTGITASFSNTNSTLCQRIADGPSEKECGIAKPCPPPSLSSDQIVSNSNQPSSEEKSR